MLYTRAYILNIGLNPSKKFPERSTITEQEIRLTLSRVFEGHQIAVHVRSFEIAQSATEPTAVIRLSLEAEAAIIEEAEALWYFIALNLSQDCIAVVSADIVECAPRRWPDQTIVGRLEGPHAAAWGAFNADYFLLPTPAASDAYAGHLPDGSSVQRHSADDAYARFSIVMECHEARGRKLWRAKKGERIIAVHGRHDSARFMALALCTGA